MKDVLIIKTEALMPRNTLKELQQDFANQLKSGVVIIPPYFEAELLNVPDDVEVIIQSSEEPEFISKKLNIPDKVCTEQIKQQIIDLEDHVAKGE